MRRTCFVLLALTIGCGGEPADGGDGGGGDGGGDAGGEAGGDAGGEAGGDAGGGTGGGDAVLDPMTTLKSVDVAAGVTSAALSADGASVVTCEGGEAKSRPLDNLDEVADHPDDCPATPETTVPVGDRTVTATGAAGLIWGDESLDTRGPAYTVVDMGDGDHVVTAGWDALYLWDLGQRQGDQQRATEALPIGPVVGAVAAGPGRVLAYGPDGLALVEVDPTRLAPDVLVDAPALQVLCSDEGHCEGALVVQNGGGVPLDIVAISATGEGFTAKVEHTGFDDPPNGVLAQAHGIAGALVTVTLDGGPPAQERTGIVTLTSNDPDQPEFEIAISAGALPLADGDDAPDFRLPDLDGVVHQLSALRGKVVHIKFLNAICASCREAIPVLETGLWTPLRETNDDFVAFVVHVGRQTRFAANMNEEMGVVSPMVLDIAGAHFESCSQVASGSLAYPLALIVDKAGKARHVLADDEPSNEQWKAWIDALLAE